MSDVRSAPDGVPDRPFGSGVILTGFGIIAALILLVLGRRRGRRG